MCLPDDFLLRECVLDSRDSRASLLDVLYPIPVIIHSRVFPVGENVTVCVSPFWSCLKTPLGNKLLLENKRWQTWLGCYPSTDSKYFALTSSQGNCSTSPPSGIATESVQKYNIHLIFSRPIGFLMLFFPWPALLLLLWFKKSEWFQGPWLRLAAVLPSLSIFMAVWEGRCVRVTRSSCKLPANPAWVLWVSLPCT